MLHGQYQYGTCALVQIRFSVSWETVRIYVPVLPIRSENHSNNTVAAEIPLKLVLYRYKYCTFNRSIDQRFDVQIVPTLPYLDLLVIVI